MQKIVPFLFKNEEDTQLFNEFLGEKSLFDVFHKLCWVF
ncbi:hypothetical protein [uncultured Gammaproteobacteria bacterium]|nr:hypothetical protein [uncultured Gammaproteobacteria bacterium]CAC9591085.1 hypothetical protein [uncultured Gammaproteobacteria bacterium]CAC9598774.1 hypothetical protein [uncultured Gammaproteobacteria bacterium]CAC9605792.1 hypothetical protein [uncultured Gammaproteobacteria bacterium]CAC9630116.1 hypothetical protein [uncultured Gammaproteobacteria bacterium]